MKRSRYLCSCLVCRDPSPSPKCPDPASIPRYCTSQRPHTDDITQSCAQTLHPDPENIPSSVTGVWILPNCPLPDGFK